MFKRKWVSPNIIILFIVGLLLLTGYLYQIKGIYISIENNTQSVLKNINIVFRGGAFQIKELKPHTSHGKRINPDGESHLELEWFDSSDIKHIYTIDVYFEHNYRGNIEITINPNNKVSWEDKVELPPLF